MYQSQALFYLTNWCVVAVAPQVVTEDVSPLPFVSMEMDEV